MTTPKNTPVKWNKATIVMMGRTLSIVSNDLLYTSKCGKFAILRSYMASGRNGYFNTPSYKLTIVSSGTSRRYDTLADAKLFANYEVDPNYEE